MRIAGTGSHLPDRVVTNADLVAGGLDTTDEWIVDHTGIRERRWVGDDVTTAQLAAEAARRALASADAFADDVDLLVLATSTPDWQQPATASAVHELLGLRPDAGVFDLNAVCSGFVYGLHAGASMLAAGESWTTVLVVGAERYSSITDPDDRSTRIFFGDGAGAVVLRKELEIADLAVMAAAEAGVELGSDALSELDGGALDDETAGIRSIAYSVDHGGKDALLTPHGAPFGMDGPAVRAYAVPAMVDAVRRACRDAHVAVSDLALLVPHQSNRRILEAAIDELGLPEGRLATTVERFGNTAAASIPVTLDDACRSGRLRDGDLLCLVGYGGGLQSAACVVRWAD
ncbi:MAG: beta-ketoacyl-ACP synthase 3 [Thermoleophilia bacterium]|nr:beta-ketoacyl-ACP synthase 3 [Thermoleophilia bacterium]